MAFRRTTQPVLSFPGEECREAWTCSEDGVWKHVEHASGGLMGIEMMAFDSAPFWSLNHEESPDEAVALRWEASGLQQSDGARLWTHWVVAKREKQALVGTLALVMEPESLTADRFEPSACLLRLPADGMAVWKELGRLVVAFTRAEALLHVFVLTARELDAETAFEIRDVCAALQTHGFMPQLEAVHVWTQCGADFVPQMACLFEHASIIQEPRPDPQPPAHSSNLLPVQVAVKKLAHQRKMRQMTLLAAAALIYLCFFGTWWLSIEWREVGLEKALAQISTQQPEIEIVREAQANWAEMEPAIDPDLYPAEIFHQVVLLLPPEGIRLKEFQIDGGKLVIAGEATTVNHALGFKDKLAACAPLQRYAWNFPVPRIRDEDNRAEFRAVGTLSGEEAQ
ncbi:hypothetical protein [Prosthecobacter sp.]